MAANFSALLFGDKHQSVSVLGRPKYYLLFLFKSVKFCCTHHIPLQGNSGHLTLVLGYSGCKSPISVCDVLLFTWVRLQQLEEQCYPVLEVYAVFWCSLITMQRTLYVSHAKVVGENFYFFSLHLPQNFLFLAFKKGEEKKQIPICLSKFSNTQEIFISELGLKL